MDDFALLVVTPSSPASYERQLWKGEHVVDASYLWEDVFAFQLHGCASADSYCMNLFYLGRLYTVMYGIISTRWVCRCVSDSLQNECFGTLE